MMKSSTSNLSRTSAQSYVSERLAESTATSETGEGAPF